MREHYYTYRQGWRAARFHKSRFRYYYNPYPNQSSRWYSFNIGWNDYLNGINLEGWQMK